MFGKYLAGDFDKDRIRDELCAASENVLEKLSREYSCLDLGKFFRWGAILPGSISENMEVRSYIKHEVSVSFYLECCNMGVSLEDLHGEARELYKRGGAWDDCYSKVSSPESKKEPLDSDPNKDHWYQRDQYS
ncbi:hypothetical protein KAR91_45210 [Candidatus Pacearchaeota archaeon]|nr:hypothetical protein [Candidatus Pacearchaeota archaeon]